MDARALVDAVIDSDRRYFTLGAEERAVPGGVILHVPGHERIGAAAVAWIDRPGEVRPSQAWVDDLLDGFGHIGAHGARVYGVGAGGPLAEVLAAAGFTSRREVVFTGHPRGSAGAVELVPIVDDPSREARRKVCAGLDVAPDGHDADPDGWIALDDRRVATGAMVSFVAMADGVPIGLVSVIEAGPLLRLKNLLVRPDQRRRGWAGAMVVALGAHPVAARRPLGLLALDGEPAVGLYRKLGMDEVGTLVEWARPLADR